MSVSLSSVTAGTFTRLLFALTCVGVITAARSLAECQLGVQGSPGSVVVSLNCSTAANSAPFIVGVNSTLVTATNINGVLVQEAPGVCKPANGAAGTPISALLYFCGDYSITFLRPVVQGVSVDSNNTAVIAFGGNIDATISSGISSGNSGRMLLLTGQAAVHLQDSTFSNNSAAAAAVALTADNATLTISNSTIIGNQALAPAPADPSAEFWRCTGGALLATGSSSISIQGSLLSNNSAAFGAALATLNFSSATIADSVFQYNSAGVAGGVACGEGNSTQVFSHVRFDANTGGTADKGAGGAIFLRDSAAVTVNISDFVGNTARTWGGSLYIQNNTKASISGSSIANSSVIGWGGSMNIYDDAVVNLTDCKFSGNSATAGGGAVFVGINTSISISNCHFSSNTGNEGGGMYANSLTKVVVAESTFLNNSGTYGAGMICKGNSSCNLSGCSLSRNAAVGFGGGLYVAQNATVQFKGGSVRDNTAQYGAGCTVTGSSSAMLSGTAFSNNSAVNSGGAVYVDSTANVSIEGSSQLFNNSAVYGGGLCCVDQSNAAVSSSTLQNNTAGTFGGAAYVSSLAKLTLLGSTVDSNRAESGGGLWCEGSSNTSLVASRLVNNTAKAVCGGLFATAYSQVYVEGSTVAGNVGQSGGAFFQDTSSSLTLQNSHITDNRAVSGGAMYIRDNATAMVQRCELTRNLANSTGGAYFGVHRSHGSFTNCQLSGNRAADTGGAVYLLDTAEVRLDSSTCSSNQAAGGGCATADADSNLILKNASVTGNTAFRGGGIYLATRGAVKPDAASTISNNTAQTRSGVVAVGADFGGVGGGVYTASDNFLASELFPIVQHNMAPFSSNIGVSVKYMRMISNATVEDFASRLGSDEGLLQVLVNMTGPQGLPCHGAQLQAVLNSTQFLGINRSDSSGVVYMIFKVQKPPGFYDISLSSPEAPWVPAAEVTLHVRGCMPGEVTPSPDACLPCPVGYYSLDPSKQVCDVCPTGAECAGSAIIPQLGMWSSTGDSVQVHSCPNPAGCRGDRGAVTACANDPTCRASSNFSDLQCSPQYHGHLCGKCVPGYGPAKPFVCRACMQPAIIIALYVVAGTLMLLLIRLLCYSSRQANRTAIMNASSLSHDPGQPGLQAADLLKPVLLYLQWQLVVASAAGIDWGAPLSWAVTALGWAWSVASPETLSIQCLLARPDDAHEAADSSFPVAVKATLLYLFIPIAMLVLSLLIDVLLLLRPSPGKPRLNVPSIVDSLMSNTFIASFIFLPLIVRTVFGLFACVPIDAPVAPPAAAAAVGSYWASDPSLLCFKGLHRAWALALGVPLVLLVCLCLPATILYKTLTNRKRLDDPSFMQHWGSLYLSFKPKYCFYEGVIAWSTILLVAISVFGLNLGRYYQSLVLNVALAVIFGMFIGFRPYAQAAANTVSVQAVMLLMLTSYVGMSLLPALAPSQHIVAFSQPSMTRDAHDTATPGPVYATVVGTFTIVLIVVFIASVVWRLLRVVDWQALGSKVQMFSDKVQFGAYCASTGCSVCGLGPAVRGHESVGETLPTKQHHHHWLVESAVSTAGSTVPGDDLKVKRSWKGPRLSFAEQYDGNPHKP